MRSGSLALGAAVFLLVGCGSGSTSTGSPAAVDPSTPSQSPPEAAEPTTPLVGEWERVTTCDERVAALQAAGLGEYAAEHAAGEGWIPGVSSPEELNDPAKPCADAEPLKHSHFFTEDGLFGSKDAQGDQVDDGTYEVTDDHTVVVDKEFGQVTFMFEIDGDQLFLDPVMPRCAKQGCFAAQWAVAVAYPGLPWDSVD